MFWDLFSPEKTLKLLIRTNPKKALKEHLLLHVITSCSLVLFLVGMAYYWFIRRYESPNEDLKDKKTLTQKDLVSFSYQVARGMEYLASRRVC